MVVSLHVKPHQDVGVQESHVRLHLQGCVDLVALQLLVHAEQNVVGVSVISCGSNESVECGLVVRDAVECMK